MPPEPSVQQLIAAIQKAAFSGLRHKRIITAKDGALPEHFPSTRDGERCASDGHCWAVRYGRRCLVLGFAGAVGQCLGAGATHFGRFVLARPIARRMAL
jgi:hypothetical protein